MKRFLVLTYGVVCYGVFLLTFLYGIGFLGNFAVPHSIDAVAEIPLWEAISVNLALLSLFALQHSVMARPAFKRWWTSIIPDAAERSTYVLLSSLALLLLFWQWRPMGGVIWEVEDSTIRSVIYALYGFGWLTVFVTTCLINHFDLFGLRQVWFFWCGKPYQPLGFVVPGPYNYVRHPLYIGWLTAFWATPTMTLAHLLFAVICTLYILFAIRLEEKDLEDHFGEVYASYKRKTPMLLPLSSGKSSSFAMTKVSR